MALLRAPRFQTLISSACENPLQNWCKFYFLELITSCSWIYILVKKENNAELINSYSVLCILCLVTKMSIHSQFKFPIRAIFIFSRTFLCPLSLLKAAVRGLSLTRNLMRRECASMCCSLSPRWPSLRCFTACLFPGYLMLGPLRCDSSHLIIWVSVGTSFWNPWPLAKPPEFKSPNVTPLC